MAPSGEERCNNEVLDALYAANSRMPIGGTIRIVCILTCSKTLTGSQLSLPHGINYKTKNKMMSVIGPVSPVVVLHGIDRA